MAKSTKKTAKPKTQHKKAPAQGKNIEDGMMETVQFGAKAIIAAGVLGALGGAMRKM
jgi:hypothetical protein